MVSAKPFPDRSRPMLCKSAQMMYFISQVLWSLLIPAILLTVSSFASWSSFSSPSTFYHASICEGSLRSRNSVRPSVRLSHAWIVTNLHGALQIFWYHTKGQSLCYSDTNSGWWATLPSLWNLRWKWPTAFEKRQFRQISTYNFSTVRDCEKSSIMTNIKSTTRFPMSHRWSAYVTPKCPKGWLKERFFVFWVKVNGWSSQALST